MNTLVIVLIAAVVLVAAYALYGRWLVPLFLQFDRNILPLFHLQRSV